MTVAPAEKLNLYIAAGKALEEHAIEILAHELEIPLDDFERLLHGGGDWDRDRRDQYRRMVDEKIEFLQDDHD